MIILSILEADTIKQEEIKNKIQKEYLRRTRKLLGTKLSCRNLIKGINTWAVPLVRYSRPFLKWTTDELKQMDPRTRKLITMHQVFHPRDDVDRLCVSRKEGEEDLPALMHQYNDSKTTMENTMEDSLQPSETIMITRWTTEWQSQGNKNGKENNSMRVLNDN